MEENADDCWFAENSKTKTPAGSLTLPIHPSASTLSSTTMTAASAMSRKGGSPAPSMAYMEMYSPCGSSPGDHQMGPGGYMIMSPGIDFAARSIYTNSSGAHSRASSLAEETTDGYVPSDPPPQSSGGGGGGSQHATPAAEEYVDMMEQSNNRHHQHHHQSGLSSAASSCSITSGTPSTDMRFAEYQLDKVVSRFTPDDEDTRLVCQFFLA